MALLEAEIRFRRLWSPRRWLRREGTRSASARRYTRRTYCLLRLRQSCCWLQSLARSCWRNAERRRKSSEMVTTFHYLILSAALFAVGVVGVLTRRNIMIILMSIELMMNAVNINLIAFSDRLQQVTGQVFAIFVITVAAAEAAVGLGIVIAMFKNKETMNINEIDLMKW